ncbi:MAG: hypothetical protein EOM59_12020 [Clostridia bacterium]|nr:hypothetical protein [Clostridia bacterium]
MRNPVITLANDTHRDKPVVSLTFEKDFTIINKVKSIKGVSWSQSRGFWYIPQSDFKLSGVFDKLSLGTLFTHHMEKGTELRLIQEALGHASSKTTEIYTRVSRNNIKKMRNLLDDLEI